MRPLVVAARDERDMFETLQSVSGVGPRIALAMLSVMGPDDLRAALSEGDTKALTRVPGIGAKSAERLVLELRDKVGRAATPGAPSTAPAGAASGVWQDQVTEALTGLGYSARQAGDSVAKVAAAHPDERDISTLLRLALNIASTRVVLLHGHAGPAAAGHVIEAFGKFVVGGNFLVGLVVFGSVWIMGHLNHNMMPMNEMMARMR